MTKHLRAMAQQGLANMITQEELLSLLDLVDIQHEALKACYGDLHATIEAKRREAVTAYEEWSKS